LEKWAADPAAGGEALRPLLEDAVARDDRAAMTRWADALRAHPARTHADTFNSLLVLSRAAPARWPLALVETEKAFSGEATAVAELLTWLTGNKWLAEARAWADVLPPTIAQAPPVRSQRAELLRVQRDWPALRRLTEDGEWGTQLDFLRQAYAALAARELGDAARADALWRGLRGSAEIRGGQGFFLAGVLYTWGWREAAVELWWLGAEQGGLALEALGALARHYQVAGDAAGSLKVFRRLHELRADDDAIANNFIYFEALAGQPTRAIRELARAIHTRQPGDLRFRSTYAFVLLRQESPAEALALLAPVAEELKRVPALAFTYGLVLAANGRAAEAGAVLAVVEPATLMPAERALLNSARRP
jgi:tetratricopeptide (TPR) repeat protein